MKTATISIIIITCILVLFSACGHRNSSAVSGITGEKNPAKKKEAGKIVFDKEIHNFGTLKNGEIVSYSFVFRNSGGSPFSIFKAEKSCGCIDIKFNNSPISPGEFSSVELIFNTEGEWGNQIKGATIETSEGERKELQIGAYVENKQFNNLLNTQK